MSIILIYLVFKLLCGNCKVLIGAIICPLPRFVGSLAEAKKPISSLLIKPRLSFCIELSFSGSARCQPLPSDHPCKNHYNMASVSNASESFESIKKLIEDHTSKIKDSASKKCLRNLEMFLCSVNAPRCSNGTIFGPCRSQCKTTFRRCGGAWLRNIDLQVVDLKDCRRFPATQCTANKRRPKSKNKSIESF